MKRLFALAALALALAGCSSQATTPQQPTHAGFGGAPSPHPR